MSDDTELLGRLLQASSWWTSTTANLDRYAEGQQAMAFLSPESADALGGRMSRLSVNLPRLVVSALVERLTVTGFRLDGPDSQPDPDLWRVWSANNMVSGATMAHREVLTLGRCPVLVWAGDTPDTPRVTVESPRQLWTARDPESGVATAAAKGWVDPWDGQAYAVLYLPDRVVRYTQRSALNPLPQARTDVIPPPLDGWEVAEEIPNPLGVVPVVEIVNTSRVLDFQGRSEMADVLDPTDAVAKLLADAMVTSEAYARPRRWATGIEPVLDADGNPVNPFGSDLTRVWLAEQADANFGQFQQASLAGYENLITLLLRLVAILGNIPPSMMDAGGGRANPTSADAIRAGEAALVTRALDRQSVFGGPWADVARLIVAVRDGVDPASVTGVETVWASAETRTPAMAADAASKLAGIGIPLEAVLSDPLGYSPSEIASIMAAKRSEALLSAGTNLSSLLTQQPTPTAP
jgi:hypothetical protein